MSETTKTVGIDGKRVEVELIDGEAVARTLPSEREQLRREAVGACKEVFGSYNVVDSFVVGEDEAASDVDVGVVIGNGSLNDSGKSAMSVDAPLGTLDDVGGGVSYSPVVTSEYLPTKDNFDGVDCPSLVLYFALEK